MSMQKCMTLGLSVNIAVCINVWVSVAQSVMTQAGHLHARTFWWVYVSM